MIIRFIMFCSFFVRPCAIIVFKKRVCYVCTFFFNAFITYTQIDFGFVSKGFPDDPLWSKFRILTTYLLFFYFPRPSGIDFTIQFILLVVVLPVCFLHVVHVFNKLKGKNISYYNSIILCNVFLLPPRQHIWRFKISQLPYI